MSISVRKSIPLMYRDIYCDNDKQLLLRVTVSVYALRATRNATETRLWRKNNIRCMSVKEGSTAGGSTVGME